MTDRELIEWTAGAEIGDLLPVGVSAPGLLERLVELGVWSAPPIGSVIDPAMCRDARRACQEWLASR